MSRHLVEERTPWLLRRLTTSWLRSELVVSCLGRMGDTDTVTLIGVSPYLYYDDADSALNWMESVLGFTHAVRWRDESGRVSEADIYAGSAMVSVSSGVPADPAGRGALLRERRQRGR